MRRSQRTVESAMPPRRQRSGAPDRQRTDQSLVGMHVNQGPGRGTRTPGARRLCGSQQSVAHSRSWLPFSAHAGLSLWNRKQKRHSPCQLQWVSAHQAIASHLLEQARAPTRPLTGFVRALSTAEPPTVPSTIERAIAQPHPTPQTDLVVYKGLEDTPQRT